MQKKQKLISAITRSALSHAFEAIDKPGTLAINSIVSAQKCITDVLLYEQNPALLSHTITHALSILPIE